jgi:hypothetical protein
MDTTDLADVLNQYVAYMSQPPACANSDGVFAIDAGDGLLIGAGLLPDQRFELFADAGYVDADTLQDLIEEDQEDGTGLEGAAMPEPYLRWQANEAEWFIDIDRDCGRVTLSSTRPDVPGNLADLMAVLETFGSLHSDWAAQLETVPVGAQPLHPTPSAGLPCNGFLQV